mmetsp:Transcript_3695/g.8507  ORF Transcript_3695/g.8507 Transcript_3695/m.8507 type:complete len:101 (+) Transcript_3695:1040-1342(+)
MLVVAFTLDRKLVAWLKINSGTWGLDNRNRATPWDPAMAPSEVVAFGDADEDDPLLLLLRCEEEEITSADADSEGVKGSSCRLLLSKDEVNISEHAKACG